MRISLSTLAVTGIAMLGVTVSAASPPTPTTVVCESIIVPTGSYSWRPERVVLGVVAVPPAYIRQTGSSGIARWPYWSKSGLVVRANSPVIHVSVPTRWRGRAAIGWGNAHATSNLRIASCPPSSSLGQWNPYAGGFFLRSRSACVPLTIRVGSRSATVRFGVGKRC